MATVKALSALKTSEMPRTAPQSGACITEAVVSTMALG